MMILMVVVVMCLCLNDGKEYDTYAKAEMEVTTFSFIAVQRLTEWFGLKMALKNT